MSIKDMADWSKISSRGNVEDRRAFGPTGVIGGGIGLTGLAIILILNFLGGGNVGDVLSQLNSAQVIPQQSYNASDFEGQDSYEVFASTVLGSTNDTWTDIFAQANRTYKKPELVLFRGSTDSACGGATSDVGPHYCPLDGKIYLDETFFDELKSRFKAKGGDVAEAYVIAHEVGHNVQNQLGILDQEKDGDNATSVKIELQADCYAGLWANSIKNLGVFQPGEINEAIDAAAAVGDDRVQQAVTGRVNPETWTHGSSEQRVGWFNKGYDTGSVADCNTLTQ